MSEKPAQSQPYPGETGEMTHSRATRCADPSGIGPVAWRTRGSGQVIELITTEPGRPFRPVPSRTGS